MGRRLHAGFAVSFQRRSLLKPLELTGSRFGNLVVVRCAGSDDAGARTWVCLCDCGLYRVVRASYFKREKDPVRACSSCSKASRTASVTRHGWASRLAGKSRLYNIYVGMRQRCNNPDNPSYGRYGGRGVRVCEEWSSFRGFMTWAMKSGYRDYLTIDRVDPAGNYEPSNCEWITKSENSRRARLPGHYWRSMTCNA